MATPSTLRAKRRRREAQRDRQIRKWKATRKRGHARAAKRHVRAVRYLRKLIRRKVLLESRPSPNFAYSEFDCHDGTPVPEYAYDALDQLCKSYLEPLRKRFGAVHITSGFRHQSYNASIGGASESLHRYELHRDATASDVWCERGTPAQWASYLETLNPDGLGTYSSFVHIDNRGRVGMPRSRWHG